MEYKVYIIQYQTGRKATLSYYRCITMCDEEFISISTSQGNSFDSIFDFQKCYNSTVIGSAVIRFIPKNLEP